jgi:hypothetical protein
MLTAARRPTISAPEALPRRRSARNPYICRADNQPRVEGDVYGPWATKLNLANEMTISCVAILDLHFTKSRSRDDLRFRSTERPAAGQLTSATSQQAS